MNNRSSKYNNWKEINENISLFLKNAFLLSFLAGSILLVFYFISINFIPYIKISEFPFIVILIFVIGLLVILFLGYVITPVYYLKMSLQYIGKKIDNDQYKKLITTLKEINKLSLLFHFSPWIINFVILILLYKFKIISFGFWAGLILSFILILIVYLYCFSKSNITSSLDKKEIIKCLTLPISYFNISFWLICFLYYKIISSSQIQILIGFGLLYIVVGCFSYFVFNASEKQFLYLLIVVPIFILTLFGKLDLVYLSPIKILKLGQINVEIYLNDKRSIITGKLLFRDSNRYYIKPSKNEEIVLVPLDKIDKVLFKQSYVDKKER